MLPAEAAVSSDFAVYPCNAATCTVAQIAVDQNRNTYVAGSRNVPAQRSGTSDPFELTELSEVYVAKLDPAGATIFLATFSGKGSDQGNAIAVDGAGNILIGGSTSSFNFPLRNPMQMRPGMGSTGFLMKLSPDGSQLLYSTYFGGTSSLSSVLGVAADNAGNAYVTGYTGSSDFSTTAGLPAGPVTGITPSGIIGAFAAKVNSSGERIVYSAVISGRNLACSGGSSCFLSIRNIAGNAIGIDNAGNAYVAGNSNVTDLPTTQGALAAQGIGAWIARINASGSKMDYLTYIGSARYGDGPFVVPGTFATGMVVDASGNAYIAAQTSDPKLPVTAGAFQPVYKGPSDPPTAGSPPPSDAYVAKLNPHCTAMVYATYLGGAATDVTAGVALDSTGAAYVIGTTLSSDFPVTNGSSQGGGFLVVLNPAGSALTFRRAFLVAARPRNPRLKPSRSTLTAACGWRARPVWSSSLTLTPVTRVLGIMNAAGGPLAATVSPGEVVAGIRHESRARSRRDCSGRYDPAGCRLRSRERRCFSMEAPRRSSTFPRTR